MYVRKIMTEKNNYVNCFSVKINSDIKLFCENNCFCEIRHFCEKTFLGSGKKVFCIRNFLGKKSYLSLINKIL